MSPWNGRNSCLGLEDVCSLAAEGYAPSVKKNTLSQKGIPTAAKLEKDTPTQVNYIQGVVKAPKSFGRVASAEFGKNKVTFTNAEGKSVSAKVHHNFVFTGQLG